MRTFSLAVVLLGLAGTAAAQEPGPTPPPPQRPPPAAAQPQASPAAPPDVGFTFGARLGIAFPFGNIAANVDTGANAKLGDDFERAVPLVLEGGLRVGPTTFGLYYQWAPASLGDRMPLGTGECQVPGVSCGSGRVKRFGAQLAYSFDHRATRGPAPWLGGAIGWEWAEFHESDPSGSGTIGFKGFDVSAQGGVEWRVSPGFHVGPYGSLSLGRYSEVQFEGGGLSGSLEIDRKRWHEWLQLGVRGRFSL